MTTAGRVRRSTTTVRGARLGEPARPRLRRTLSAVLAFAAGALAGAFGVAVLSFWCVLAPVLVLIGLLLVPGPGR